VGAATARQLAEKGCHVVINYASNEPARGRPRPPARRSASRPWWCRRTLPATPTAGAWRPPRKSKWGRIDALVNNAGTTKFCAHDDLDGLSAEDFQRIYGVNTVGAYQMARAVAPAMRRGGRGSIVNVASIAGVMGVGSSIAYAASKGAMITLGLSLARVLGPEIRVNTVCPGFIQGDWLEQGMGAETYARTKAFLEQNTPLQADTATPDTVAEVIVYFLTGATVVTGETLLLDGGHHLTQMPMARR
jgi:3-oxoacyl-[acyl-carrier protein] reductase